MISALEALERLRAGNRRFVTGLTSLDRVSASVARTALVEGQAPFAVVLGCSDSRVPVEIVLDQGLGDLFVIRVAGNVVAPSQIGSVEFAAEQFGTRLVVVMGHTRCGAISATLSALQNPSDVHSRNIRSIVDRVRPAIEPLLETDLRNDPEQLLRQAVMANVRVAASALRHGSPLIERLVQEDGMLVVGAKYRLGTGEVEFFDGL